jgi:hypothetical protein
MILTGGKSDGILRDVPFETIMANRDPLSCTDIPFINSKIVILATTGTLAITGI